MRLHGVCRLQNKRFIRIISVGSFLFSLCSARLSLGCVLYHIYYWTVCGGSECAVPILLIKLCVYSKPECFRVHLVVEMKEMYVWSTETVWNSVTSHCTSSVIRWCCCFVKGHTHCWVCEFALLSLTNACHVMCLPLNPKRTHQNFVKPRGMLLSHGFVWGF